VEGVVGVGGMGLAGAQSRARAPAGGRRPRRRHTLRGRTAVEGTGCRRRHPSHKARVLHIDVLGTDHALEASLTLSDDVNLTICVARARVRSRDVS
jgi:hypothetical protein